MTTKAHPVAALCALTLLSVAATAGTCIRRAPEDKITPAPDPMAQGAFDLVTVGGQASAHGVGGFLDANTSLWVPAQRDAVFFYSSRNRFEDNGEQIGSNGLAFRKLFPERKVIVGANVFYDSIDSQYDHHFDQLGLGAEVLTSYVDWRFNYYLPETGSKTFDTTRNSTGRFSRFESGLEGLNTEVGVLLPGLEGKREVRLFGGYYHYNNPFGRTFDGFKARLEARLLPGVIADVEYWQDAALMEGHWTAGLRVSVPFSLFNLAKGRNPFEGTAAQFTPRTRDFSERLGEMIMRSPRVQTASSGKRLVERRPAGKTSDTASNGPSGPQGLGPFPVE